MTSTTDEESMSSTSISRSGLLGTKSICVLGAAVDLGCARAAARSREASLTVMPGDAERLEGLLDLVELVGLDDGGDELHALGSFRGSWLSVWWRAVVDRTRSLETRSSGHRGS
jgi:hypothetical protein